MNFLIYIISTLLLGLVVSFALSLQSAEPPTEFEKYSSATMDYASMSEVGYAMAAFGRKSAADYYQLKDYQAYEGQYQSPVQKSTYRQPSQAAVSSSLNTRQSRMSTPPTAPLQMAAVIPQAKAAKSVSSNDPSQQWPQQVVGIQRQVELMKVDVLWQEFANNSSLSNQLSSYTVSVFAVYSNFSRDYSQATVSIGYDVPKMSGERYLVPRGSTKTLLTPSQYSNSDLISAWKNIDYNRSVKAVVERRDYTKASESTSLFVIYQ